MAIHHLQPTHYHIAIGSYEPVLQIGHGDTVITSTVDAMGKDAVTRWSRQLETLQTGPFYVAGAEPAIPWSCIWTGFRPNGRSATVPQLSHRTWSTRGTCANCPSAKWQSGASTTSAARPP